MIVFRVLGNGYVEWSNDGGSTWYNQEAQTPKEVARAWWNLMTAVGMRYMHNHQE